MRYDHLSTTNYYSKMKNLALLILLIITSVFVNATEFTVSSYNCGGLTNHYDYLRAAAMQKLMQERHNSEPEIMATNNLIQQIALKILFGKDAKEISSAQNFWSRNNYDKVLKTFSDTSTNPNNINHLWYKKSEEMITSYKVRPVSILDVEITKMINDHIADLTKDKSGDLHDLLTETRAIMAKRIFHHHLKYDILCLQEADYLDISMFPENYQALFSDTNHSVNGIAWNKDRFALVDTIGNIMGRALSVKLMDKATGKTVIIASAHITGCNPFVVKKERNGTDADTGNNELSTIIDLFEEHSADIKIIAMDSNVAATHPRLRILKETDYQIDAYNFLEPTCSNPNMILNTRIDWIALKADNEAKACITNIAVLGVGLNHIQTNISDHKPVAAKIVY